MMARSAATLLLAGLAVLAAIGVSGNRAASHLEKPREEQPDGPRQWALLVAGSAGWGNYRHQADVCHAYQVLRRGGLKDENIVVMMADDIAHNPLNPHPGQIFNQPAGSNVYRGISKDYTGAEVNARNVLKVLAGDAEGMDGIGNGKVIASGPGDRVFFYFADHGAPGILGMPSGPFLYANDLVDTLTNKSAAGGFSELVAYIEACESGSVFQGMDLKGLNIYATTAANARESSWGTYCPGQFPAPPPEFSTCLGDLYSVAFLEDDDAADRRTESLQEQFERVKYRTSNNGTYMQGSHVLQWGDLSMTSEPVGRYIGFGSAASKRREAEPAARPLPHTPTEWRDWYRARRSELLEVEEVAVAAGAAETHVPQRDAELLALTTEYLRVTDPVKKAAAFEELNDFVVERAAIDRTMGAVLEATLESAPGLASTAAAFLASAPSSEEWARPGDDNKAAALMYTEMGRPETEQLVDDWDCLKRGIAGYEAACGALGQYGMKYSRVVANLCNLGFLEPFLVAAVTTCR
mmetsp:Transcript_694/g.1699  ORF Transcript_694/g.1699 Transcript_694/m.1699 type:complete len:523 (+) Transcript_694:414-1982(+)